MLWQALKWHWVLQGFGEAKGPFSGWPSVGLAASGLAVQAWMAWSRSLLERMLKVVDKNGDMLVADQVLAEN